MRICLCLALLGCVGPPALEATGVDEPLRKVASVVRADRRTGRLVRTVVVPARVVPRNEIKPVAVPPRQPSALTWERSPSNLEAFVEEMARRYDVDPLLVHSVIKVESNYDPWAVSPKGALGLMQLMPETARRFQVGNAFDPAQNIEAGVRYLKYLLTLFGDERLALAAYNAGEGAVFQYGTIPPYRETNEYVYKVGKKIGEARRAQERREAAAQLEPRIHQYVDSAGRIHLETRLMP